MLSILSYTCWPFIFSGPIYSAICTCSWVLISENSVISDSDFLNYNLKRMSFWVFLSAGQIQITRLCQTAQDCCATGQGSVCSKSLRMWASGHCPWHQPSQLSATLSSQKRFMILSFINYSKSLLHLFLFSASFPWITIFCKLILYGVKEIFPHLTVRTGYQWMPTSSDPGASKVSFDWPINQLLSMLCCLCSRDKGGLCRWMCLFIPQVSSIWFLSALSSL